MKYLTVVFCLIITFLIVIEPLYAEVPKCRWDTACLGCRGSSLEQLIENLENNISDPFQQMKEMARCISK